MRALDYSIWWGGLLLEVVLVVRSLYSKVWSLYPAFHLYILFVLTQSLVRLIVFHFHSSMYRYVYWITEFLGAAIGCLVVFEIYRVGLASYPGTARMARKLLAILFVMASTKALVDASKDSRWWAEATTADIERAVRTVQALAIAALVTLFLFYAVPFSRHLKGILLGYGMFIGASVLGFTFAQAGGERPHYFWTYLNPASYDLALCLWVVYLWSPQTQPDLVPNVRLEEQYQQVAARTRRRLQQARGFLARVIDP